MSHVRVDPSHLISHAARVEAIRDAIAPISLPAAFAPAGAETASAVAATRISASAASVVNGLWSAVRQLDKVATLLRTCAEAYAQRDQASATLLSGGGHSGPVPSAPAVPAATAQALPQAFSGTPPASPEQLAFLIRQGAGASAVEDFAQQWTSHAQTVHRAGSDLAAVRSGLGAFWSGSSHDAASEDLDATTQQLGGHADSAADVGRTAHAHAAGYRRTVDGIPTPAQFASWRHNLDNAVAANNQYPGVYTAAVTQAQEDLGQGYEQATGAYGPYVFDPLSGQVIDTTTGEAVDPLTGEPLDAAGDAEGLAGEDGQELLSTGSEMLNALMGAGMGAAGAAMAGMQQFGQAASQAAGQLAKAASSAASSAGSDMELPEFGGDAGGFGGGGGVGGGGMIPAAASGASGVPAPSPPAPATPIGRPGGGLGTGGVGGFGGMPMMPMGAGAGAGAGAAGKAKPAPDRHRIVAPKGANTQKVIGESSSGRVQSKQARREQRMKEARRAAAQQQEGDDE